MIFSVVRSRSSLSAQPTPWVIALFFLFGSIGVLGIVLGAQFPVYWTASMAGGWKVFHSRIWWIATGLMFLCGLPGYFALKAADRAAGILLERFGAK